MKTHYTEADLLETYYMQPGESMPVMMHLAKCEECAIRYERLKRKLREAAECGHERPVTFWARQEKLIMNQIGARKDNLQRAMRTMRIAAAAAFAFFLGGAVMYETMKPMVVQSPPPAQKQATVQVSATSDDPWESDALKDFHSVVQWESWIDSNPGDEL
jgi:hypothetical protein